MNDKEIVHKIAKYMKPNLSSEDRGYLALLISIFLDVTPNQANIYVRKSVHKSQRNIKQGKTPNDNFKYKFKFYHSF